MHCVNLYDHMYHVGDDKKLARDRAVGKRLAVAVHPDKVPEELNSVACELFKILQEFREAAVPIAE